MADFNSIVCWLIFQEDDHKTPGKVVDLGDQAGLTRLGLTQRWYSADLPMTFFSTMSFKDAVQVAKHVYKIRYWDILDGDLIIADTVAAVLLSFAVNGGIKIAVKTLQSILGVAEDGQIGPRTIAELNLKDPEIVVKLFRSEWEDFYHRLVSLEPYKAQFLSGWISRSQFPYPSMQVPIIYA